MALSLLLIVMPLPYREGVAEGLRRTLLWPVLSLQRGASDREGRYAEVERLRAERDSLASFLVGQAGLAQENRELRALLGFQERLGWSFTAAEARRMYTERGLAAGPGSFGMLQLSAGARDGVSEGSPVVTSEGLVGSVQKVGEKSSQAMDWTNPNFRVSAMTVDGETYGIAEPGEGPGGERLLTMSPNALHTAPDTGALIVTSGDGQMYPRGIPVGRVVGSGKDNAGWQRTYYIRPLVSPAQSSHVLVLGRETRAPTDRDLAAAWGVRLTGAPPADSAQAVSPDAAAPAARSAAPPAAAPRTPPARRPAPSQTPAPRRVDPTPGLPGRPVYPGEARVPPGMPAPTQPRPNATPGGDRQ